MSDPISSRLRKAWNVFFNKDPTEEYVPLRDYGPSYSIRPDRTRLNTRNERSIITAIYNRIALDVAAIKIQHVQLDERKRFKSVRDSQLNKCLSLEANIDEIGRAFIKDVVISMFDEGVVAIVPVETIADPRYTSSYDIGSWRVAKITQWYPQDVKVEIYNEYTGRKEEKVLPKRTVAIIENPFYEVMNSPNATMQRLIRKLNILDAIDEQSGSGKLDLIIQLPYVIKSESRKQQAEARRKDIETQLTGSKYGIAYTDGTEKIIQLNRAVENNMMSTIEYLTSMLFSQLGITQEILNGTADDKVMTNYQSRIIEPCLAAIADEMKRKFLSKKAITEGQSIMYFSDPFKLVPVSAMAELADKMTRNEIMTSNEIRQVIGMVPSEDPNADQLRNKNLSQSNAQIEQMNEQMGLNPTSDIDADTSITFNESTGDADIDADLDKLKEKDPNPSELENTE